MPKDATSPPRPNPPSSPYKKPRSPPTKHSPTPYTITFGAQHKGQLLSTCKPDWVKWVIKEQVYTSRADLKAALIDHGYMNEDGTPGKAEPVASPSKPKICAEVAEALEGWLLPRRERTRQFWDVFREQDTWITTKNALEFYKLPIATIHAAGLHRVVDGNSIERYYEWQINALANYVKPEGFSPHAASRAFATKNRHRESEIMAAYGFGVGLD